MKPHYNGKPIASVYGPQYHGFTVKYHVTFEDGSAQWVYHHNKNFDSFHDGKPKA